jgi:hypothetical protein
MTKAKRYDTVVLHDPIGRFQKGEKGAVVEVYTVPYEAYDIEIVTNESRTKGLAKGVRGAWAAVRFSDGTEVIVSAEELYAQSGR